MHTLLRSPGSVPGILKQKTDVDRVQPAHRKAGTAPSRGISLFARSLQMQVCASCKQETVKHVDGRGMLFISYGRPIDRIRTACVCCTFCGVLCK